MTCEMAAKLRRELESKNKSYALYGYAENRGYAGVSRAKAKKLFKNNEPERLDASNALSTHVGSCPVCRAEREAIAGSK